MLRKFLILFLSLTLSWTTFTYSSAAANLTPQIPNNNQISMATTSSLNDGKYPIQQATYNDANGEYSLMLLNTPVGTSPVLTTTNVQMARLTDEELQAGTKTYLKIENNQPVIYLTEDFKIEYVHNVVETKTDAQTGETQTVIVRRESNFWTPFAGALAGQMVANLLFTPQYYVPPMYQPGGVLVGYGGYGRNYNQAVNQYRDRYQTVPPAVKNSQVLRTTGSLRNNSTTTTNRKTTKTTKSTGSGYGSSNLGSSGQSSSQRTKRFGSFGSNSSSGRRSFSRRRR